MNTLPQFKLSAPILLSNLRVKCQSIEADNGRQSNLQTQAKQPILGSGQDDSRVSSPGYDKPPTFDFDLLQPKKALEKLDQSLKRPNMAKIQPMDELKLPLPSPKK